MGYAEDVWTVGETAIVCEGETTGGLLMKSLELLQSESEFKGDIFSCFFVRYILPQKEII